jgi:lactate dehydrogenase-like 2-hydroxyacid dehydrogenase
MNDAERLAALAARLNTLNGLDEDTFDRLSTALDRNTAVAAKGHKAICIFVNDTCDAEVVETLAAQGVELVALRCAGFNNVALDACNTNPLNYGSTRFRFSSLLGVRK